MNRIKATKDKILLLDYLVPALLLVLPLSWPCWPRMPLPAPWSSWSPVIGIIRTNGAWCHSFLLIITQSGFVIAILTASLTCWTSGVLWTPTTVIQPWFHCAGPNSVSTERFLRPQAGGHLGAPSPLWRHFALSLLHKLLTIYPSGRSGTQFYSPLHSSHIYPPHQWNTQNSLLSHSLFSAEAQL